MNEDTRSKLNERHCVPEAKSDDKGENGSDHHTDRGSSDTGPSKSGGETGEKSHRAPEKKEQSNPNDGSIPGKYEKDESPEEDWPGPRSHDDLRF